MNEKREKSVPLWTKAMRWAAAVLMGMALVPAHSQLPDETPVELKFSAFFRQPVGARGLEISDALRAADGRMVKLVGYMVAQEQPAAGRFLLTPRPVRMSESADGDADDLPPATVTVIVDDAQRDRVVAHRPGLIVLTGRLAVGREEDATGRVSWVRLRLPAQALAQVRMDPSASPQQNTH